MKNNVKQVTNWILGCLENEEVATCNFDDNNQIFVQKEIDSFFGDDYESKEYYTIELIDANTTDIIEASATGSRSAEDLENAIQTLFDKHVKCIYPK